MQPVVTDQVAWFVCRSVCLYVTLVIPAETAEKTKMPFGLRTQVGLGNHVFTIWVVDSGGQRKHKFNRICQGLPMCPQRGHIGATWRIRLNHLSAAVIRHCGLRSNPVLASKSWWKGSSRRFHQESGSG